MEKVDDRYLIPFSLGSELTAESFMLGQNNHTYMLASPRYKQFYEGYMRPRSAMYRGWIEGFHNMEYGSIPSFFLQKVGTGIVSTLFNKPLVLNSENPETNEITLKKYKRSKFFQSLKEGYGYAMDTCAGLLKWNRDGKGELKAEAIPGDMFFPVTDAYGEIERVKCFIATYHDTVNSAWEYYLCEERFFKYGRDKDGKPKRYPAVHYLFYKTSSNITNENKPSPDNSIRWSDIPYEIQQMIKNDYGNILIDGCDSLTMDNYDKCTLLPFDDDLGCRMLKFTRNIPAFPKMPFGQPLADLLMNESYAYDQLKFFERVEVYISRGRIMAEKGLVNPNDPESGKSILDPMVFTYYGSTVGESDDKKPSGIQLELRADAIARQKQNILNDTAFALNLSATTIASWLSDGQTQKTAKEIEFEKTKTTTFINDKLEIIQEPLQEMIDMYYHYYGVPAPELNIMPESQAVRSEDIQLNSELYDKGHITSEMLAKSILGTCSLKEVQELAKYIEEHKVQLPPNPLNPKI